MAAHPGHHQIQEPGTGSDAPYSQQIEPEYETNWSGQEANGLYSIRSKRCYHAVAVIYIHQCCTHFEGLEMRDWVCRSY